MGVDPTFNLGDFSVTPIVYQHLLVEDKNSSKSPWLLGHILIYCRFMKTCNGGEKNDKWVGFIGHHSDYDKVTSIYKILNNDFM